MTGSEELVLSAKDREKLGTAVLKKAGDALAAKGLNAALTLSDDTREMVGGIVLRRDGIEINCSIDALVDMQRGILTADVAAALFE